MLEFLKLYVAHFEAGSGVEVLQGEGYTVLPLTLMLLAK